ncbi:MULTISPECIES: IclR family transcriptional regulator [Natrialbaceae]|uniref:IclR family transcriptional regulator n=1 Tax=Natrialbaceae TaxID=1644061 RepID=UPI00207C48CF|nr:IclR family transcriptional regulator [Natronococcus sp. CG52]
MANLANSETNTQTIKSVDLAFNIIDLIEEQRGATVSEIAAEYNMAESTTYVYLRTLAQKGYITKSNGKYHTGIRFLKHGGFARQRMKIYRCAKDEVNRLADETGELVSLAVEDMGKRVVLYRSEGEDAVYDRAPTGEYTHMHWTALGKALLASLPRERVKEIIDTHGLPAATENTITKWEKLCDELDRINKTGYAIGDEERRSGLRSVGKAFVCGEADRASIAIAGPTKRLDKRSIDELIDELDHSINIIKLKYEHY